METVLQTGSKKKRLSEILAEDELKQPRWKIKYVNFAGTKEWQKQKKNLPCTEDWFKTWRTLSYLTKGRKNHYMLPIKEELEQILIKFGVIKDEDK